MSNKPDHRPVGDPCKKCGFKASYHRTPRKRGFRQNHNAARSQKRELTKFVAIDGEGVTLKDGTHNYVLLTVGKESLIAKKGRLTWKEIFPFLYKCFQSDPHAAYVGYYLGYDFTQWVRTLSESRAESLFTNHGKARRKRNNSGGNPMPFPVYIGDDENRYQWEFDILGTKRCMLRPGMGENQGKKNPNPWMYICDVGPFFQQSFLKTLNESIGVVITKEEYETIRVGKEKRSSAKLDNEMIKYNLLECELLERIIPLLNDGFKSCGIKLGRKQWMGPGQAAQQWMKNIGVPPAKEIREVVPPFAKEAARATYFGGWFEIFVHGIIPGITWEYDVNSAYPNEIAKLPCLLHGKWEQIKTKSWNSVHNVRATLVMVYGEASTSNEKVGSMLHRTPKGNVLRPQVTKGWYWRHEIEAAMKAGVLDKFKPSEYISYTQTCECKPPFEAMTDLYLKRLEVGKGTPRGKAYKLVYNSSYGKLAQSIGSPKFANPIYASLITCGCRVRILEAIATHPTKTDDLVMVATDGVYFKKEHPSLELDDNKLGAWTVKKKSNLLLFMPGLYWDDSARGALETVKLKSRGVPARDMAKKVLDADKLFEFEKFNITLWPEVELDIDFTMVTAKQALARGKWYTCGYISSAKRTINANPSQKRRKARRENGLIVSSAYEKQNPLESSAYDKRFGEELEMQKLGEHETVDGNALNLMREYL
jgi:hypothetical protein